MNKIVRSICYFTQTPGNQIFGELDKLAEALEKIDFAVQTKRLCSSAFATMVRLDQEYVPQGYTLGLGSLAKEDIIKNLDPLLKTLNTHFNLDLTGQLIGVKEVKLLFDIIGQKPSKTFNFAYVFNNPESSPFFPSGRYGQEGFSLGLQPTDLSLGCKSLAEWLERMDTAWKEINGFFKNDPRFLGIDSSVAPGLTASGSFIGFIESLSGDFAHSTTTDVYLRTSRFIKENNPKPVGLCGLMFPCLEDAELSSEYEKGNFTTERNIYLSLHCGLGIDTYPLGTDESPERVLEIMTLIQALSDKYRKPLSIRFVSDGRAKIGQRTEFKNPYLKDVIINKL